MVKLILLGLLAGVFFSSTFILNELMSNAGGHWFWSASLRYIFMWLIITAIIILQHGFARIKELATIFRQHWGFGALPAVLALGYFIRAFAMRATTSQAGSLPLPLCLPW